MERILHPVSGESGYFTTEQEKTLIDAILNDFSQSVLRLPHSEVRGNDLG